VQKRITTDTVFATAAILFFEWEIAGAGFFEFFFPLMRRMSQIINTGSIELF
jgi:hypothetical protein